MEKDKSLPMEKDTDHYLLLFIDCLFVRIIGFKILLFPIIDSIGNPLRIFIVNPNIARFIRS